MAGFFFFFFFFFFLLKPFNQGLSQFTQTPEKVFHKLLKSFHMQKKLLHLQRYQIFYHGTFFFSFFLGGCKAIWRIVRTSEKILATPLVLLLFQNKSLV